MATSYLMQAATDGSLVTWLSVAPDWIAEFAPALPGGAGPYQDICVAGGGIDNGADATPDGAMVFDDGSFVVFDDGSFAVTTGGGTTPDDPPDGTMVFDDGSSAVFDDGSFAVIA